MRGQAGIVAMFAFTVLSGCLGAGPGAIAPDSRPEAPFAPPDVHPWLNGTAQIETTSPAFLVRQAQQRPIGLPGPPVPLTDFTCLEVRTAGADVQPVPRSRARFSFAWVPQSPLTAELDVRALLYTNAPSRDDQVQEWGPPSTLAATTGPSGIVVEVERFALTTKDAVHVGAEAPAKQARAAAVDQSIVVSYAIPYNATAGRPAVSVQSCLFPPVG